jgi:AraC-like DNA-binding protein
MEPFLIDTTPQFQSSYFVKRYEDRTFSLPYHMHDKYEITWIKEGQGSRIVGDNVSFFKKNDVLVLGPMLPHQWQSSSITEKEVAKSISLFFKPEFPSKDFWFQEETKDMKELLTLSSKGLYLEGNLKKNIIKRIKELSVVSGAKGMLLVLEIIQIISDTNEYQTLASEGYINRKNLDTNRINKITNYIFDNLENKITLKLLSEIVNLHPNSLSREFKRATGFSIVDYINKVRIGRTTRLLTETSKPIVDICYECGFQNLSHFNRYFKKVKNCTPTTYRKSRM